jgi:hypothetical protein
MFENKNQRVEDLTARAERFLNEVWPEVSEARKQALTELIKEAQRGEIPDKERFVSMVNDALDATRLRIQLPDGELARLRVTPGRRPGTEFIQFELIGRGPRGGFATANIGLVAYVDRRKG